MLFFKALIFILPVLILSQRRGRCVMRLVTAPGTTPISPIGTIRITRLRSGRFRFSGRLRGLPPGAHGFHIHENYSLDNGCLAAGAHLNLRNMNHGGINTPIRHEGDLGNVYTDQNGITNIDVRVGGLSFNSPINLSRRTIVIHQNIDDLGVFDNDGSRTVGNSGGRIACGFIVRSRRNRRRSG